MIEQILCPFENIYSLTFIILALYLHEASLSAIPNLDIIPEDQVF
jgi:hypothetical protein